MLHKILIETNYEHEPSPTNNLHKLYHESSKEFCRKHQFINIFCALHINYIRNKSKILLAYLSTNKRERKKSCRFSIIFYCIKMRIKINTHSCVNFFLQFKKLKFYCLHAATVQIIKHEPVSLQIKCKFNIYLNFFSFFPQLWLLCT